MYSYISTDSVLIDYKTEIKPSYIIYLGISSNRRLISHIFEYYDEDADGLLTRKELSDAQNSDHMEKLAMICSLTDLLLYHPWPVDNDHIALTAFNYEFGEMIYMYVCV